MSIHILIYLSKFVEILLDCWKIGDYCSHLLFVFSVSFIHDLYETFMCVCVCVCVCLCVGSMS